MDMEILGGIFGCERGKKTEIFLVFPLNDEYFYMLHTFLRFLLCYLLKRNGICWISPLSGIQSLTTR